MDRRGERAQLWGIYFQLLAVEEPPPFLALARDELQELLDGARGGDERAATLTLIDGGGEEKDEPWRS